MFQAPQEPAIGLIDGKEPNSKQEYWVYLALVKYNIPHMYQFEILGGRTRRGGLIVDFLVWNPRATPLEVNENYWHKGEMEGGDSLDLIAIEEEFKIEPIVLWSGDMETYDDVDNFIRHKVAN